jgi:hypothetical protein
MSVLRRRGVTPILLVAGIALFVSVGAGMLDTLRHENRSIGSGAVVGRYTDKRCLRLRVSCTKYHRVRVHVDRADQVVSAGSDALYDLVGPGNRTIPVEIQIDDFTDKISRLRAQGRTYVTYDNTSKGILFLLVPLAVLGLACVAITARPVVRAVRRGITAQRTRWRWAWVVGGGLVFAFCVGATWTGLTGDDFDAGRGELFARYARFDATGYHEGAHVHIDAFARDAKVESRALFALLESPRDRLPIRVSEDSAGEIAGVTYRGRTYDTQTAEWLGLLFFVPLGLFAAWGVWLNGRELRRARA